MAAEPYEINSEVLNHHQPNNILMTSSINASAMAQACGSSEVSCGSTISPVASTAASSVAAAAAGGGGALHQQQQNPQILQQQNNSRLQVVSPRPGLRKNGLQNPEVQVRTLVRPETKDG